MVQFEFIFYHPLTCILKAEDFHDVKGDVLRTESIRFKGQIELGIVSETADIQWVVVNIGKYLTSIDRE